MGESANQRISEPANQGSSVTEQILDLLLEALLERQAARKSAEELGSQGAEVKAPPLPRPSAPQRPPATKPPKPRPAPISKPPREPRPGEEGWTPPPPLPSIGLGRTLGRLLVALAVLVVVINVPINRYGTSLARMMPDTAALVIRDGLVLKGSGPEIYVLEGGKLRWISSLEAFEFFGYRWEQVHIVEDSFLEQFEKGRPIHVLLKCQSSPHIYALENGQKRWIKDIPTFEAQGYVWEDVKFVSCDYLRNLPDGPPIPEDAGSPPQP